MGSVEEKIDLDSDEEIPFSVSQPTIKMHSLNFEPSRHILAHPKFSASWVLREVNRVSILRSIYIVLIKAKINVLLPFGPLAIMLHYLTKKHGLVFFFSLLGITPLAERLGYATEQLACFTGPTVGGLLNATFGNATEMIISIYALKNGMIRVVQQSLLGSILSNMLLVLGCAFFCGGVVHNDRVQHFNKATAVVSSGLLLMAVMCILFPAVLLFTHTEVHKGKSEMALSRVTSCIMLIAYASYLFFQLKSQSSLYSSLDEGRDNNDENPDDEEVPEITYWESIVWLAVLTLWISVLSGYLVDAIQGASDSLNMPIAFISVILLPIVGNAAEHASAIMFAMKDKLDITLGVAIGSSTQISMFVIPFCVIVGWIMGKPMDLNFQLFETATLFITVLVVAFMLQEGQSNYFKGLMLILCYLIVAASFFVHIDPTKECSSSSSITFCSLVRSGAAGCRRGGQHMISSCEGAVRQLLLFLEMAPVGVAHMVDLDSDEEVLFSESQTTNERHSLNFERFRHISLPPKYSSPWVQSGLNRVCILKSIYSVMIKPKINVLLPFGQLAIVLHYYTEKHGWVFFFSFLGITPLAERLGYVTKQLTFYTSPTVDSLVSATICNTAALAVSIYGLKNGMIRVVQQSLLGLILSNILLVLGCAFFCAVLKFTHGKSEIALSRVNSCIMLFTYASYVFFQLKCRNKLYSSLDEASNNEEGLDDDDDDEAPEITHWEAIGWLAVLTLYITVLFEYLVDAMQGVSNSMNVPVAFIDVILLPLVENASAIMFMMKDKHKLDVTVGVAIESSVQITMFVYLQIPFCVILGWIMGKQMVLNFPPFEIATLFITVLAVAFTLRDGQSNYFKGLMFILCYLVVAATFFVYGDPTNC
ncbi:cation exchanger 5 [Perilla frutescens var. frutescens]|nr:cation exchanger 5 [Perilla frutescens var. frutescens]